MLFSSDFIFNLHTKIKIMILRNFAAMEIEKPIVFLENSHLLVNTEQKSVVDTEPPSPPPLTEVEKIIEYSFKNKELLEEAFTHASKCSSFQRLEFLGDSVLGLLITKLHYFKYQEMAPGELTKLRSTNVDTEALARAALKHKLHKYLRHQKPLLNKQIEEFEDGIAEFPSRSCGMIDPPKVLADLLEALIGAIFVDTDSSMDDTWKVVETLLHPLITPENLMQHPMAMFNEACQKAGLKPHLKDLWNETGRVEVYIDDELVGSGSYRSKKAIAINRAANDAYKKRFGNKYGEIGVNQHPWIGLNELFS